MIDLRRWNISLNPGAKIFTLEDGVILTYMLSYILYRIFFAQKYSTTIPSVENKWSPKITKRFYVEFDSLYLISKKLFRSKEAFQSILFSKQLRTMPPSSPSLKLRLSVYFAKTSPLAIIVSIISLSFCRHLKVGRTSHSRGYYDVTHKPLRHSNTRIIQSHLTYF